MDTIKRIVTIAFVVLLVSTAHAQTGIGTTTPNASAKLEVYATNKGFLPPRLTLTSATDATTIASPAVGLLVYNMGSSGLQAGYYYWNGTNWTTIVVAFGNLPTAGDVKTGIQTGDHNGWIKLDGRLKSTLTASQQTQATALGIGTNLPDATNAVLMQSSGTLGTVTGTMSTTIAQNQLPNITPAITVNSTVATMQNTGGHQHPVAVVNNSIGGYAAYNPGAFKNGMAPTTEADADVTDRSGTAVYTNTGIIGSAGEHSHAMDAHAHSASATSINGGVTQQAFDKTPRSLVVNTFIYLGF